MVNGERLPLPVDKQPEITYNNVEQSAHPESEIFKRVPERPKKQNLLRSEYAMERCKIAVTFRQFSYPVLQKLARIALFMITQS